MGFYYKKPVMIEAVQFRQENYEAVQKFCPNAQGPFNDIARGDAYLIIPTLEGQHHAVEGDYIIRDVTGELSLCKPDIFERTYETAAIHNRFARMVTDDPKDNVQTCYNLYYIKDQEVYVRGYGDDPADPDVSLFKFIRDLIKRFVPDAEIPDSDMDLGFMLSEWLMFGCDCMEGVLALLYTSAWAMSELRHMLGMYEIIGAHPMELADRNRFVDEWIRGNGMTFKQVADLISLYKGGGIPLSPVKIGDKVWFICWDHVANEWVADEHPVQINDVGTKGFYTSETLCDPDDIDEFHPFDEIGDVCFLSLDLAKAAAAVKTAPEEDSEGDV